MGDEATSLAATFFSFGIALIFMKIREDWWTLRNGKIRVIVYLKESNPQAPTTAKVAELSPVKNPQQQQAIPAKVNPAPNPTAEILSSNQDKHALVNPIQGQPPVQEQPQEQVLNHLNQNPAPVNPVQEPIPQRKLDKQWTKEELGLVFDDYKETPEGKMVGRVPKNKIISSEHFV